MFICVLFVLNVRIEICSIKRSDASLDHKLLYILTVLGGKRIFVAVVAVTLNIWIQAPVDATKSYCVAVASKRHTDCSSGVIVFNFSVFWHSVQLSFWNTAILLYKITTNLNPHIRFITQIVTPRQMKHSQHVNVCWYTWCSCYYTELNLSYLHV